MTIDFKDDIAIINMSEHYETTDIVEIMDLYRGEELKKLNHIIYNCENWQSINVLGGELLMLKEKMKNQNQDAIIFCNASDEIKNVFDILFNNTLDGEPIIYVDSMEEALKLTHKEN